MWQVLATTRQSNLNEMDPSELSEQDLQIGPKQKARHLYDL